MWWCNLIIHFLPDILLASVDNGENSVIRLCVGAVQKGGAKIILFGAGAAEGELDLWLGTSATQLKWNDRSIGDLQW